MKNLLRKSTGNSDKIRVKCWGISDIKRKCRNEINNYTSGFTGTSIKRQAVDGEAI